jgi:uncharacterized protein
VGVAVAVVVLLLAGVGVVGLLGTRLMSTSPTAEPGLGDQRAQGAAPTRATDPAGTAQPTGGPDPTTPQPPATTATPPRRAEPVLALGDHPINTEGVGLPATTCALPRFGQDAAAQAAFYRAGVPCLDTAWSPVLSAANLPTGAPSVEVTTGEVSSPCGSNPANTPAFYCPTNRTIYLPAGYYSERFGAESGQYLAVLAHEYGHHVQGITGIFDAYWDQRYEAGPQSEAGLEFSRRLELQATCYAGMFVAGVSGRGSVDGDVVDQLVFGLGNGGDDAVPDLPRDHGTMANNARWADQGRRYNLAWQCNTWLADASSVG